MASVEAYKATANLARGLAEAMRSRAVIEQAKGILMAEKRVDPDTAFDMLTQMSQHANIKLRDIAARIVEDRVARG
jgi:AmiR/NasT family two-component response regulator